MKSSEPLKYFQTSCVAKLCIFLSKFLKSNSRDTPFKNKSGGKGPTYAAQRTIQIKNINMQ